MNHESKIYIFHVLINARQVGTFGAFDDQESTAKQRMETFFQGMSPYHRVEACLIDIVSIDAAERAGMTLSMPLLDRRKSAQSSPVERYIGHDRRDGK